MIDREKLQYVKNVLSLQNTDVDTDIIYNLITAINRNDDLYFLSTILELSQPNTDISLLKNVLRLIKENPSLEKSLLDSFSHNQIGAKTALLNAVDNLDILTEESTVVIWAGWFGSVLIPKLATRVKKIVNIDLDEETTKIAKNHLMTDFTNVEYICDDVFNTYRDVYLNTNLIINTSCEHMPPMKDWKWFGAGALSNDEDTSVFKTPKLPNECYFAFQSNNMFGIEGHVNCVNSLQEFKDQMPERAEILFEEEIEDTRGTRYMLVGKFNAL